MANPVPEPEEGSAPHSKAQGEKAEAGKPVARSPLRRAWGRFLHGVSYFSGDMEVFGNWMKSE